MQQNEIYDQLPLRLNLISPQNESQFLRPIIVVQSTKLFKSIVNYDWQMRRDLHSSKIVFNFDWLETVRKGRIRKKGLTNWGSRVINNFFSICAIIEINIKKIS